MKIRRLVRDPAEKPAYIFTRSQCIEISEGRGEFVIAHRRMDGLMADRMNRHDMRPAAAFRHEMMPFDLSSQRPRAQSAGIV